MMKLLQTFLCVSTTFSLGDCILRKIVPIIDEKFENCATAEEDAEALDRSNIEIIAESDTEVYINGSLKFLRQVGQLLPFRMYAEKLQRDGQWLVESFNIKRPDFCDALHNPTEVWYAKSKKYKCPLKAGVRSFKKL
jgi:hypothetical protein